MCLKAAAATTATDSPAGIAGAIFDGFAVRRDAVDRLNPFSDNLPCWIDLLKLDRRGDHARFLCRPSVPCGRT